MNTAVTMYNSLIEKRKLDSLKQIARNNEVPIRKEYLKQPIPNFIIEMSFSLSIVVFKSALNFKVIV